MQLEWMGRYRELVAALILNENIVSRNMSVRVPMYQGIGLIAQEWQTLEYLLEHEDENDCMNRISERLGIPQSSLSKAVKNLVAFGLVERFRRPTNRKNVILRATPLGRELYVHQIEAMKAAGFGAFFEALDRLDDEAIARFTLALNRMSGQVDAAVAPEPLIPLKASGN